MTSVAARTRGSPPVTPSVRENMSTRSRTVLNDPVVQGTTDTDNGWWQARALMNSPSGSRFRSTSVVRTRTSRPGPAGPYHLFELVDNAPACRLLMSNGDHGTQTSAGVPGRPSGVDGQVDARRRQAFPR